MRLKDFTSKTASYLHLVIPSVAVLLIHFVNNAWTSYGIFRDELYYIACSEHLAFGYVDQPPLAAFLLLISRTLFGDSVFALRIFPSIAHGLTVFLSGVIAEKSGGGKYAQILTAVIVGLAPDLIGMFGVYSMNAFEILLWSVTFLLLFRLIKTRDPRYWYWIGAVLGIGMLNKVSMSWLGAGILAGVLFSNQRYWLKTVHPYAAAAIALLIFFPYLLWNVENDFAHFEFAANASRLKYASQNPVTFFTGMVLLYNPVVVPVLAAGFIAYWRHSTKDFRLFGIIIFTVLTILIVNIHSKTEYFNSAAILVIAAGAVQIEQWFLLIRRRWMAFVYVGLVLVTGSLLMPMAIDILPVHTYITYAQTIGFSAPSTEGHDMSELPQHFADRFGWKELAQDVSFVYNSLSPAEQSSAAIYVQNYGQAGAIDHFGKQFGLPRALSGHNNYWIWGKERIDDSLSILIAVGGEMEDYKEVFQEVVVERTHRVPFVMPYENNRPIYICRKPIVRLKDIWHSTKSFI
ncbi:MAG: ArnT family glycosyltransferase [Bacteroidota bacterium]